MAQGRKVLGETEEENRGGRRWSPPLEVRREKEEAALRSMVVVEQKQGTNE